GRAAQAESGRLSRFADRDISVYQAYIELRRRDPGGADTARALQAVTGLPLDAARSALSGLDLCVPASEVASGAIAAGLGTAAIILAGAVRAFAVSASANFPHLPDESAAAEIQSMVEQANLQLDYVLQRVRAAQESAGSGG